MITMKHNVFVAAEATLFKRMPLRAAEVNGGHIKHAREWEISDYLHSIKRNLVKLLHFFYT